MRGFEMREIIGSRVSNRKNSALVACGVCTLNMKKYLEIYEDLKSRFSRLVFGIVWKGTWNHYWGTIIGNHYWGTIIGERNLEPLLENHYWRGIYSFR
jgi:hypothetical protein